MYWFWNDPFRYLYIYDEIYQEVKYVRITNDSEIIPKDYKITRIGKYHTIYSKGGCYDILLFPVVDIERAKVHLMTKYNQQVFKEMYDRENSFSKKFYNFLDRLFKRQVLSIKRF